MGIGARATSGVTVMRSPMSSRPSTVMNSRPGTGHDSRPNTGKAREPGLAPSSADESGLGAQKQAVSPLMTGQRSGKQSDSNLNLLSGDLHSCLTFQHSLDITLSSYYPF